MAELESIHTMEAVVQCLEVGIDSQLVGLVQPSMYTPLYKHLPT